MKTQLKNDEKVVMETRPHWFTLIFPGFITLAGTGGCIALMLAVGPFALLGILIFALYFLYKFIERKNNLWAVTNLRVIDEEGVFSNNAKESPLDKINNVAFNQTLMGKMFGFGNVQIQTAAEVGATIYYNVEKPRELKDAITQMQEEYKVRIARLQANELVKGYELNTGKKTDVAAELEKLYGLREKGIITDEEYQRLKAKILN
jgi:uncharacterized membrane protein YdbT with pleckstrin-like domain